MTEHTTDARGSRKLQILEAFAQELERCPGEKVTTAALARSAGVTEAALYRHFPSKAKMFESLLAFAEETVFVRINQILAEESATKERCRRMVHLLLGFGARNPGITRVLMGDALTGEHERLHDWVERFFNRLETQVKQVLREAKLREKSLQVVDASQGAALMVSLIEGNLRRFLRSRFQTSPLKEWEAQWQILERALFP